MAEQMEFDEVLLDQRRPQFIFAIQDHDGKTVAKMNLDGTMTFATPPDAAAQLFWQAIESRAKSIINSKP